MRRECRGQVSGMAYVGIPMVVLVWMRNADGSSLVLLWMFLVIWASDSAAFVVGRIIRGPLLYPSVSPAKTWAGAIGGLLASVATGAGTAVMIQQTLTTALVLSAIVCLAAQTGDLVLSALKRRWRVKDTGCLIPGHGGLMDRLDLARIRCACLCRGYGRSFPWRWTMPPSPEPRRVAILGATGSIGASTLDLINGGGERYRIEAVTARTKVRELAAIARATGPAYAAIADEDLLGVLRHELADTPTRVGAGPAAVEEAACMDADWVMAAIVGAAGLAPTLAAIRQGRVVALANKEALVCAGELMIEEARKSGCVLLPADSEHNAIFQVFDAGRVDAIEKIWLTASGGPFRNATRATMATATPEEAVRHPNWSMGPKISVDSATMMEQVPRDHRSQPPVSGRRREDRCHRAPRVHCPRSGLLSRRGLCWQALRLPTWRTPIAHTLGLAGSHPGTVPGVSIWRRPHS